MPSPFARHDRSRAEPRCGRTERTFGGDPFARKPYNSVEIFTVPRFASVLIIDGFCSPLGSVIHLLAHWLEYRNGWAWVIPNSASAPRASLQP